MALENVQGRGHDRTGQTFVAASPWTFFGQGSLSANCVEVHLWGSAGGEIYIYIYIYITDMHVKTDMSSSVAILFLSPAEGQTFEPVCS